MKKKLIAFFYLATTVSLTMYGQVTIGSGIKPQKGVILDLKEFDPDMYNSTSEKAFIIPRVFLNEDLTKLVIDEDSKGLEYAGAQVFNTNPNLSKAIYVWDGSSWNNVRVTRNKAQDSELVFLIKQDLKKRI
ncbi:MAG: hypothetical protein ACK5M3_11860 [Dysgonomonas sp.]